MNPLTMHAGHSMDCKAKLNAKMNEYALEYEAGVWTSAAEKKVSFVRMASMHNGAQEFASRKHAKGLTCWHLNLQQDEYRVQVQFDKGGASTKVTMHSYNLKEKNSIRNSYLIGIYEGDKDDRETIRAIFGGLFKQISEINNSLTYIDLPFTWTHSMYEPKQYRVLKKADK
jgi:hypothetical protein